MNESPFLPERLRVLFVEDDPGDVRLMEQLLADAGFKLESQRVQTAAGMEAALQTGRWDLVVSDQRMPQFDGLQALAMLKGLSADTPFILVSEHLGEELAVAAMKAGASDYVLKTNLTRLVPAVQRELVQARERTRRRRVETALAESEETFRQLSESSPLGIFLANTAGQCQYVNPRWRKIFGTSLVQSIGDGWLAGVHPADREQVRQRWTQFIQGGSEYEQEYRVAVGDGASHWAHMRVNAAHGPDGGVTGFVGTVEDITERKTAEAAARANEQRFTQLFTEMTSGFALHEIICDRHGRPRDYRFLAVNHAFETLTGLSRDKVIGRTVMSVMPQTEPFWIETYGRVALTGERIQFEHYSGNLAKHFEVVAFRPVPGQFATIFTDITQRMQLESQLRQAQKMEAVGQLAGGIAHDFNNLLNVIIGFSDIALRQLDPATSPGSYVQEVRKAGERAAGLTRQLLAFSRKQLLSPKVLDLNVVVADLSKMLRRLIREDIQLEIVPGADLGHVRADPGQLEQVIINMAVNARDAMPGPGRLTIRTANATLADAGEIKAGNYVMISVTDTGSGMTEEVKSHLFEPFFTTKPVGKGTGLGLATCYGIIRQSDGHIRVESAVGKGTTFWIYLPCVAPATKAAAQEQVLGPLPRGTETILLTEDEPALRELTNIVLSELGYRVLSAGDGEEALRIAGQGDVKIDLLVSDVVLPNLNGKALSEKLSASYPGLKTLFVSGYTEEAISHHGVLDPGIAFLQKPFPVYALACKVRELLDRR